MCTLCIRTGTFDPGRHVDPATAGTPGSGPLLATVTEGADAADSIATVYSIQVGDTFEGALDVVSDRDWVAVTLQAGETYAISLTGTAGSGGLYDPLVRLYDGAGNYLGENDDISTGVNLDSQLTFTAPATGTYYVSAGAFFDQYIGSYELSVSVSAPPPVGTLDELADYLTDGFWQDGGGGQRSFDTSASNVITVDITTLSADGQQLARWALDAWEMVADIVFVEVNGGADITFLEPPAGAGMIAQATSNVSGSTILSSTVEISADWIAAFGTELDSYSFSTFVHEIGHALGLGHQGNYNGSAVYGVDETFANDSWQISVMSYFSQTANTTITASYAELLTPMMADILAIQNLYGAPGASSDTAGDTTWGGASSTLGNYLDTVFDYLAGGSGGGDIAGNPMAFTIYDKSGIDTVDLSWSTSNDRVDLRQESFSDIGGLIGNVAVARGTILERVIAGQGNDTVFGNVADNFLEGRLGADVLHGKAGSDTLLGGNGNDTLYGGIDFDELHGNLGNDLVVGGNGRDTFYGEAGNDVLQDNGQRGFLGGDLFFGGNGADTIFAGGGNDTAHGQDGDDLIYGGLDNDLIYGGINYDEIHGQLGNDTLFGGNGRDTLHGGDGNDVLHDNGQSDVNGGDRFFGGSGNDTLHVGGGGDTVTGGPGSDTFIFAFNHGNDVITDFDALDDNEKIDLSAISAITDISELMAAAVQTGQDVLIDTGGGNSILLHNVDRTDLDADDFIFV